MNRFLFSAVIITAFFGQMYGQSTAFVLQGGPTVGLQRWDNSFEREPLFQYHAALGIESVNNEDDRSSFIMQLGYHVKGSATRFTFLTQNGGLQNLSEGFKFNNFSLMLGAKQKFELNDRSKYFYFGGIRGDYTYSTNIDNLEGANNPFTALYYPYIGFVRRWMAGISVGGGLEFQFTELVGGQLTLTVAPDVTNQYYQPPIPNVVNPSFPGQTITIQERRIRNTAIELSLGIRLLRKVEYIE